MTHTQCYSKLYLTALSPEFHEKTAGYWYTVTNGAMAHTAFTTRRGLERWLEERGLKADGELPAKLGEFATMRVTGEYVTASHGDRHPDETSCTILPMVEDEQWSQLEPVVITATMSNGRWTLALITEEDGVRTVHTLNPNVKTRIEVTSFPGYTVMRGLMS